MKCPEKSFRKVRNRVSREKRREFQKSGNEGKKMEYSRRGRDSMEVIPEGEREFKEENGEINGRRSGSE